MLTSPVLTRTQTGKVCYEENEIQVTDQKREILQGLMAPQKRVNPKYFYDQRGSELFEAITNTPEYYPTRTERQLLRDHAQEIAALCQRQSVLLEPGSGSCEKVRLLLDAIRPAEYVPMDISGEFLYQSAQGLVREFPWLNVRAICSDFSGDSLLPELSPEQQNIVFYPGSTIGNMSPVDADKFLQRLRQALYPGDLLILGVDLKKDSAVLNAAYNDKQGITAEFNLNILNHLNQILEGDFSLSGFEHCAFFNEQESRIEMHLVSKCAQIIHLADAPLYFAAGETLHTENSYKYTLEGIQQLGESAGFALKQSWLDPQHLFSVNLLEVAAGQA